MKTILTSMMLTLLIVGLCRADDKSNFGRYTTLRLGVVAAEYELKKDKILTALCRYEFKTEALTQAMTNQVLARFNWTSYCAAVNPSKDVYVYDCPVMKAGNIFSWDDLNTMKSWVDNNPKIAMDWIRDDERDSFDANNGIQKK